MPVFPSLELHRSRKGRQTIRCFHTAIERPSSLFRILYDSAFSFPGSLSADLRRLCLRFPLFSLRYGTQQPQRLGNFASSTRSRARMDLSHRRAGVGSTSAYTRALLAVFSPLRTFLQSSYLSILASVARSLARLAGLTQKPKIPKK